MTVQELVAPPPKTDGDVPPINDVRPHRRRASMRPAVLLVLPAVAVFMAIYVGGMVMVVRQSFLGQTGGATTSNYSNVLQWSSIGPLAERTVVSSAVTVVLCLLLGLPVARYLVGGRWRTIVMWCTLSPLFVSAVGRVLGWYALLGPRGPIAWLLTPFGNHGEGILFTNAAVVIGFVNVYLPFMILALVSAFADLDEDLIKAATSLGAGRLEVLRRIELPLLLQGIITGSLLVFALCMGSFIVPAFLGSQVKPFLGYQIYLDILSNFQLGQGSALAVLLVIATLAFLSFGIRAGARQRSAGVFDS